MTPHSVVPTLAILIYCLATFTPLASQNVVINEFASSNRDGIVDMDGDAGDWIELYNTTGSPIDLTGYGLSDRADQPNRWVFPRYTLEPHGHLLVWASGKDRRPPQVGITQGLRREVFSNIQGTQVNDLVTHPSYPNSPSQTSLITGGFEAPTNAGDNYGQRIHGYLRAPATGDYTFYIAGDDQSSLFLSTDSNPSNAVLVAQVPSWTNPLEWGKFVEQTSLPIRLEEGKLYYISALMKEQGGGDNLAVGWRLPNGTFERPIAGSHLFWEESELHTNFSIRAGEEGLLLTDSIGQTIDLIPATRNPTNVSYGRYPDGANNFVYFIPPTPGQPNAQEGYAQLLNPPIFSRSEATFSSPFYLTISTPDSNALVYYTIDGTSPMLEGAMLYTDSIPIVNTVNVRAVAQSPHAVGSPESNRIYSRIAEGLASFSSNLPIAIIHQFDSLIIDETRRTAYMIVMGQTEGQDRVTLVGKPTSEGYISAEYRGSSSLQFPKKMMGIHLTDADGEERPEPLLGLPQDHNWVLYAPYPDKTLMRNAMAYQMSADMGRYAPRTRFFELFLHSGTGPVTQQHYHGVYLLVERIKWGAHRVNIERIEQNDNQEPQVTGGYIIKKDRLNQGEQGLYTARGSHFVYVRPNETEITSAQSQWLREYLNRFERALFGSSYRDPEAGYKPFIDMGSFIDFHIMVEVCKQIDGFRLSTFLHKDRNGRLNMGPVWDYNLSLGNADYLEGWQPKGWYYPLISQYDYLFGWYTRMFSDPEFARSYNRRWWQLRRGVLSYEHLSSRINRNSELLSEAQVRNFVRWPILGTYVWPNPAGYRNRTTYESEVTWMDSWLKQRLEWMDQQLGQPSSLIHYWHFNNLPSEDIAGSIPSNSSLVPGATLTYSGSGGGYADRVNDNTPLNAELADSVGYALRLRNPSSTRELVMNLPTTGYADIALNYAVKRTTNGAKSQRLYYRTSPDMEWTLYPAVIDVTEMYQLFIFDFGDIEGVDNNPNFSVRVLFTGEEASGSSGNNRIDNITVEGYIKVPNSVNTTPGPSIFYYDNMLRINNPSLKPIDVKVYDITGRVVGGFTAPGAGQNTIPFTRPAGVYIVRMHQGGAIWASKVTVY